MKEAMGFSSFATRRPKDDTCKYYTFKLRSTNWKSREGESHIHYPNSCIPANRLRGLVVALPAGATKRVPPRFCLLLAGQRRQIHLPVLSHHGVVIFSLYRSGNSCWSLHQDTSTPQTLSSHIPHATSKAISNFHIAAAQQPDSHDQPQEHSEGSVTSSARYSSTVYSGTDNRSRGAFSVHESASESPNFVYTSPTGVGFTKAELNAWARGKKNENGDLVFFKPGFISDDPWKRLRPETGNSG